MLGKVFLLFLSLAFVFAESVPERKLLSFQSTETNNQAYEINEFRKQLAKFVSVMKDQKIAQNQFRKTIEDHFGELKQNLNKGREIVKEMHNNSMVSLDGIMTVLGFGLD